MSMLTGLIPPSAGTAYITGLDIATRTYTQALSALGSHAASPRFDQDVRLLVQIRGLKKKV